MICKTKNISKVRILENDRGEMTKINRKLKD